MMRRNSGGVHAMALAVLVATSPAACVFGVTFDEFGSAAKADSGAAPPSAGTPTWTDLTPSPLPATWPEPRARAVFVYDSARDRFVLWGGVGARSLLDDLWELDPATGEWFDRTPTPRPEVWPSGRAASGAAYDAARGKVVLFGGGSGHFDAKANAFSGVERDVWELDVASATWERRDPKILPASWPSAAVAPAMAYDGAPTRQKVVMFNGRIWDWESVTGAWTERALEGGPDAAYSLVPNPAMAYDTAHESMLLVGVAAPPPVPPNSGPVPTAPAHLHFWEWQGASGIWSHAAPSATGSRPSPRTGHGLVYDVARDHLVLFGGLDPDANLNLSDLWEQDPATKEWFDRSTARQPPARANPAMAYDQRRSRTVLFGGRVGTAGASEGFGYDLWAWRR